jgi:hypothetical protein
MNTNFPTNSKILNKEIQNFFRVAFDIFRANLIAKSKTASTWFFTSSIFSVVPAKNIYFSSQKESKPITVWRIHHLLVQQSIRIAHYKSWLFQIRSSRVIQEFWFIFHSARKEHAIKLCSIMASYNKMLSVEVFCEK